MGVVLGLSLTSTDVAWVLVDEADRSVIDHDVIDVHDTQIAGAAARGAHAIATNSGFDIHRVRLTWEDDVAADGRTLRTRLGDMGFPVVETVPVARAMVVMVQRDLEPALALAYGAALAELDARNGVATSPRRRTRGLSRIRIAAAVVGAAAAAAFGGLLLVSGSAPQIEQTASATVRTADSGWVAVAVPAADATAGLRVVDPDQDTVVEVAAVEVVAPVRQVRTVAVAPAPVAATAATAAVPHLPEGVPHLAAGPAETAAAPVAEPLPDMSTMHLPDTEMTVPVNLFTALP